MYQPFILSFFRIKLTKLWLYKRYNILRTNFMSFLSLSASSNSETCCLPESSLIKGNPSSPKIESIISSIFFWVRRMVESCSSSFYVNLGGDTFKYFGLLLSLLVIHQFPINLQSAALSV